MTRLRLITAALLISLFAAAGTALFIIHYGTHPIEGALIDFLFARRGKAPVPQELVIVKVDEKTYQDLDEPYTKLLPRKYYTQFLKTVANHQAKAVAFDISIQDSKSNPDPELSSNLAKAMRSLPVILPRTEKKTAYGSSASLSAETLRSAAAFEAAVELKRDGHSVRRFPSSRAPFLALAAAKLITKVDTLPQPNDYISYYGPAQTIPSYSLSEVLANPALEPAFKGKLVFIGYAMEIPSVITPMDSFMTPFGLMHGVEIHATMAGNLISGKWIRRLKPKKEAFTIYSIVLTAAMLLLLVPPVWSAALYAGFITAGGVGSWHLFKLDFYLPGLISSAGMLLIVLGIKVLYSYLASEKSKLHLARQAAQRENELSQAVQKSRHAMVKVLGPRLAERAAADPRVLDAPEEGEEVEAAMKRGLGLDRKPLTPHAGTLQPGTVLDENYIIERALGEGASGAVYLAQEKLTAQKYALKVLKNDAIDPAEKDEYAKRFLREIRLSGAIENTHVVKRFDFGLDGAVLYFTMEYIEGGTLEDIASRRTLTPEETIEYGLQILKGLSAVHDHGIVHRDLKAANVMIAKDGTAKLTDFGLARPIKSTMTTAGSLVGTPVHIAPELWDLSPATNRSDIYALGVLFYRLLTGNYPFQGENLAHKHKFDAAPEPHLLNPAVPEWLSSLVVRMLHKDPEKRPGSAGQVMDEIKHGLKGAKVPGWEENKGL